MPLTAYSQSFEKELDVEQLIHHLSRENGLNDSISIDNMPEEWRTRIREDIECPCCFVTGAEIVKPARSRKSKEIVRQSCFRFVSPGHHPHCDFMGSDDNDSTPDNWIAFHQTKSNSVQIIRALVCTGIEIGAFNQKTMRDMREWFFNEKKSSQFEVTIDPRTPRWIQKVWHSSNNLIFTKAPEIHITDQIMSMPGFSWLTYALHVFIERYREVLATLMRERLFLNDGEISRIEKIVSRHHGQIVFNPTALEAKYKATLELTEFITTNYEPLLRSLRAKHVRVDIAGTQALWAFAALLLYKSDWEINQAAAIFVDIATSDVRANQDLGNVMGLNPFHDYRSWELLTVLQKFDIVVPSSLSAQDEIDRIKKELESRHHARSGGNQFPMPGEESDDDARRD